MTPDELREKVARAICAADARNKKRGDGWWRFYLVDADAAIAIMRPEVDALRAEVERLKRNLQARLADHINGTPCAEIRWRQDREALTAEVERLRIENIQMQAALGYGIMAEDERHIIPTNPFKCGTCDASKHLRAEVERLKTDLATEGRFREAAQRDMKSMLAENERLRIGWETVAGQYDDLLQEASHLGAEVERLRAELHTASDMNAVYEGRLQEKEAEVERLRAVLISADASGS